MPLVTFWRFFLLTCDKYKICKYIFYFNFRQQKSLFDSIKPLFNNKPLIVVANKSDVLSRGELSEEQEALFKEMEKEVEGDILEMSTVTENGVMDVKVTPSPFPSR